MDRSVAYRLVGLGFVVERQSWRCWLRRGCARTGMERQYGIGGLGNGTERSVVVRQYRLGMVRQGM